jgi:hypothetical protein
MRASRPSRPSRKTKRSRYRFRADARIAFPKLHHLVTAFRKQAPFSLKNYIFSSRLLVRIVDGQDLHGAPALSGINLGAEGRVEMRRFRERDLYRPLHACVSTATMVSDSHSLRRKITFRSMASVVLNNTFPSFLVAESSSSIGTRTLSITCQRTTW